MFDTHDSDALRRFTRRTFFKEVGYGVGSLALLSMLSDPAQAMAHLVASAQTKGPHFAPKAKSVIFLFMAGAPSQLDLFEDKLDLFEDKPMLVKHDGQPVPDELIKGERFAFVRGKPLLLASPYKYEKVGQAGHVISKPVTSSANSSRT